MGAEYIPRRVFDFEHYCVILLNNGVVTGATSARLFHKEQFFEIAFLAVNREYHRARFGTMVMNYFKTVVQSLNIVDIFACADVTAISFFHRLGFTGEAISIHPDRWKGRVMDYIDVVPVITKLGLDIDYMDLEDLNLRLQAAITAKIGKHFVHSPPKIRHTYQAFTGGRRTPKFRSRR
jgi:ribosomal protein S18 acetylase RimI-like enzyme